MQQTFVKSIDGFDIEFSKLLFPSRYKLLVRRPNQNPVIVVVNCIAEEWRIEKVDSTDNFSIDGLSQGILSAIYENEEQLQAI